jgi:hypothetical protein
MSKLTAIQFQEKHARRLTGAIEDVRQGIQRVTESPTIKAAASKEKMRANLNAAIDNGKWEAGLKRVTLEEWKDKAANVGVNRIAAGINAAKAKVVAFAEQLLPYIDTQQQKIKGMPSVTLEDNIARMNSFVRGMAAFKRL